MVNHRFGRRCIKSDGRKHENLRLYCFFHQFVSGLAAYRWLHRNSKYTLTDSHDPPGQQQTMIIAERCVHFHRRRYLGTPREVRASNLAHSSASIVSPGCRSKHVKHNTNVESSISLAINCVARMSFKACKTQYKRRIQHIPRRQFCRPEVAQSM